MFIRRSGYNEEGVPAGAVCYGRGFVVHFADTRFFFLDYWIKLECRLDLLLNYAYSDDFIGMKILIRYFIIILFILLKNRFHFAIY